MAETKTLQFDEQLVNRLLFAVSRSVGAFGSATQALLNGAADDPAFRSELLIGMEAQVYELERLLDNIVQLRAWQRNALSLTRRPVGVHEWLPRLVNRWGHRIAADDVGLQVRVPSQLRAVDADPDRLNLVLDNLVAQAFRCTTRQDHVILAAENGVHQVRIAFTVPCTCVQDILKPSSSARYRRFSKELGLEIPIAQILTAAHGGRLEIEQSGPETCAMAMWWPTADIDEAPP